jgi:hypothetical protein
MKTFSTNALAELLERDRATITRALRHVPKDATEKGQQRWKMTTAIAAVDALPGSHNSPPRRRSNNNSSEDDCVTALTCVYRKLKRGRNDGDAHRGSGVNE